MRVQLPFVLAVTLSLALPLAQREVLPAANARHEANGDDPEPVC
jgi:hypothetical protein